MTRLNYLPENKLKWNKHHKIGALANSKPIYRKKNKRTSSRVTKTYFLLIIFGLIALNTSLNSSCITSFGIIVLALTSYRVTFTYVSKYDIFSDVLRYVIEYHTMDSSFFTNAQKLFSFPDNIFQFSRIFIVMFFILRFPLRFFIDFKNVFIRLDSVLVVDIEISQWSHAKKISLLVNIDGNLTQ